MVCSLTHDCLFVFTRVTAFCVDPVLMLSFVLSNQQN